METEIVHDPKVCRFTARLGEKEAGWLSYKLGAGTMTIDHTFVAEDCRGQGIARKLVDAAEAFAKHEGLKTAATCSYAAGVLKK